MTVMQRVVAINDGNRVIGRDYSIRGQCMVMATGRFQTPPSGECTVLYLHANDVRGNSEARTNVLAWAKAVKVTVVLFTNSSARGADIQDFPGMIVHTWDEILLTYPSLPHPERIAVERVHLPALALLCQGYLSVCAEFREEKTWHEGEIQRALDLMGWTQFIKENGAEIIKPGFGSPEDWRSITNPDWWLDPFCVERGNENLSDDGRRKAIQLLRRGVQEELKNPAPMVCRLIDLIESGEVNRPKVVADAYCELHLQMGGLSKSKT